MADSIRDQVYERLMSKGVSIEQISDQLGHIVRGESVRDNYKVLAKKMEDGSTRTDLVHVSRQITRTQESMVKGLQILENLPGMNLNLAARDKGQVSHDKAIAQFAPPVDMNIIYNEKEKGRMITSGVRGILNDGED